MPTIQQQQQQQRQRTAAQIRIDAVSSRTSARAAAEFFVGWCGDGDDNDKNSGAAGAATVNWKTLPQRVDGICRVLEGWVRAS